MRLRRTSLTPWLFAVLYAIAASAAFAGECPFSGTSYSPPYTSPIGLPRCGGTIGKWTPCEVCLISRDPFSEQEAYTRSYTTSETGLQPRARFTQSGTSLPPVDVDGFFDGLTDNRAVFRIRFTPTTSSGTWNFSTTSSDPGLSHSGSFTVGPSTARGFLRRDPEYPRTFIWDDGTRPFLWGQTYYQIVNQARAGNPSRWQPSITNSAARGMNKIRLLVSPWGRDPRDSKAESKAFQKISDVDDNLNRDRLDMDHWRALDQVASFLHGRGVVADLILFHDGDDTTSPYSKSPGPVGPAQNARYTRYTVARYAAFPNVIWTLSNEYQLVTGTSPGSISENEPWNELGCLIRGGCRGYGTGADPWIVDGSYRRPLSNQNNINTTRFDDPINWSYPCFEFFTAGWPGHISLQTKRGENVDVDVEASTAVSRNSNLADPNPCLGLSGSTRLPVINDEYYYVGTVSNTTDDRSRHRHAVWSIAVTGGFGSTGSLRGPLGCNTSADNPTGICYPTLHTDWLEEPHYGDIRVLTDFFRNTLNGVWWQMSANNARVSRVNNLMRVYALDGPATSSQYLVYAVPNKPPPNAGKFNVNLPVGTYTTTFVDPRGVAFCVNRNPQCPKQRRVTCPRRQNCTTNPLVATRFTTPTFADWALRVVRGSSIIGSPDETLWVSDTLPDGAIPWGDSESWNWVDDDPTPISDSMAHQSNLVAGMHQHFFYGATETLPVNTGDVLFAYVYLDPLNPPSEVMLQWNDGSWEHRAYWGANQMGWGTDGTNSCRYMGPLPATDQWVRLEVPASSVGLEGRTLNGMAFSLFGGKATWDDAGKSGPAAPPCDPVTIEQHPQNQTIVPGQSVTVSVVLGGTPPYRHQWYEGASGTFGQAYCGGDVPSCTIGPLTTTKQFWVAVRGACGTQLFSDAATITVQCTAAPQITVQPTSRVTTPGQSTTLSVSATQAVSMQWYQGNSPSTTTPIPGATGPTLTVAPGSTTNYWVRVTNSCGIANSETATVCVLPAITAHPTPRTINPGQSTTLSVSAINAAAYQWYVGSAPSTTTPVGGNSSALTVSPTVTLNYWARASNACGFANSTTATVTVAPPPPPQITRLQSNFALANSQTSITANWTQPTQPGTFLVAVVSAVMDPNPYITFTPPAGWSHAVTSEWTNIKLAIYYLPNNAGGRTSETFTTSIGYHDMTLYVFEYSGIMATNPLDKTAIAGNDTNNGYVQTGFTQNTVQPKEIVITALTTYTQTEFSTVPGNGYTEIYDKYMLYHLTTAMHEKITTSIGSYGHDATVYVPAQWVGLVATFKGADTN